MQRRAGRNSAALIAINDQLVLGEIAGDKIVVAVTIDIEMGDGFGARDGIEIAIRTKARRAALQVESIDIAKRESLRITVDRHGFGKPKTGGCCIDDGQDTRSGLARCTLAEKMQIAAKDKNFAA